MEGYGTYTRWIIRTLECAMSERFAWLRGLRTLTLGVFALSILFLGPRESMAAVAVGDDAPDVTGGAHFNCEPISLSQLKGRVVFLELFSTT